MGNEILKEITVTKSVINLQICCKILLLLSALPVEKPENPSSTTYFLHLL